MLPHSLGELDDVEHRDHDRRSDLHDYQRARVHQDQQRRFI